MMNILDLGLLSGEVLVFGGPLSNLQATEAVLAEARQRRLAPGQVICTGDVVGYCAQPAATVAAIRAAGCPVVAGNAERQLAAGAADCGCGFAEGSACDIASGAWFAHAGAELGPADLDWMQALPDMALFSHAGRRYAVVHGGLTDIARFVFPSSPEAVFEEEINAVTAAAGPVDAVIAGHCGIPFERVIGGVHWINAGVIGMPPHDGRRATRFVVLREDGAHIERLRYDWHGARDAMRAAGLVQGYDTALDSGIWPSEDILPAAMRRTG